MGALFAIVVVLFGDFDDFEIRVLLTSVTIGLTAICVLASAAYRHPVLGAKLGYVAMGLQLIAATLLIFGIWGDHWYDDEHWQVSWILATFGIAFAHVLALLAARLKSGWKWIQVVSAVIIFLLASLIAVLIIDLGKTMPEELVFKCLAVLTILSALATLVIPILHVISKSSKRQQNALVLLPLEDGTFRDLDGRLYRVEEVPARNLS